MHRSLGDWVLVNPPVVMPFGAHALTPVSFVPMSDVSESGEWLGRQVRALHKVRSGLTAFADGDVLVAKITPCFENGKGAHISGLTNGIGFGSTEFHVLRARPGTSPRFVHHLVQSARLRRKGEAFMSGSAGQRRVARTFLEEYPAPDLTFDEQVAVSHLLDTLDATIRKAAAIIEKLKLVKQGLLHDLLTRGIDDNGELRPPQSAAPHLYKASVLGWIPRDWLLVRVDEACSDVVDCPHSTPNFRDDGVLVARTMHIKSGTFLEHIASRVSEAEYHDRITRLRPEAGDVIFTREAPVGEAFMLPVGMQICLGQRVMLLRPKYERMRGEFLIAQVYSGAIADRIAALTAGTTNPHLNVAEVRRFLVPLPPVLEQAEIGRRLFGLGARIESEVAQREKLLVLKSGLMDDILTGRVRVTPLLSAT